MQLIAWNWSHISHMKPFALMLVHWSDCFRNLLHGIRKCLQTRTTLLSHGGPSTARRMAHWVHPQISRNFNFNHFLSHAVSNVLSWTFRHCGYKCTDIFLSCTHFMLYSRSPFTISTNMCGKPLHCSLFATVTVQLCNWNWQEADLLIALICVCRVCQN